MPNDGKRTQFIRFYYLCGMKAYSIRIYGRVFNVGFRRYVHRYADGSVHIEAEGEEADLTRFTILCGEGTPYSRVLDMKIEAKEPTDRYSDFRQIR